MCNNVDVFVPVVDATRSQCMLLVVTNESENTLDCWGIVCQFLSSICCPFAHLYCFPVGDLVSDVIVFASR